MVTLVQETASDERWSPADAAVETAPKIQNSLLINRDPASDVDVLGATLTHDDITGYLVLVDVRCDEYTYADCATVLVTPADEITSIDVLSGLPTRYGPVAIEVRFDPLTRPVPVT